MHYPITYPALTENTHYDDNASIDEIEDLLNLFRQRPLPMPGLFSGFFILDYTRSRPQLVTGPVEAIERGFMDILPDFYGEEDFMPGNQKVFGASLSFLKRVDPADHINYLFTYTYRLKDKAGQYRNIYQKGSYVTDSVTGLPLFSNGLFMDITHLTNEPISLHMIDRVEIIDNEERTYNLSTEYFYDNPYHTLITRREKEVLTRMAEGLSSKEIAAILFVSESTVINHRKNLLKKTHTKNVAELITLAIRNRVI